MECRRCHKQFSLGQLTPKQYGMVPKTTIKRYAFLCKDCLNAIDNNVEPKDGTRDLP